MARKKASAKIQGIVWASCIIFIALLWILDLSGVFGDFKIFQNFGFWSWVVLVAGIAGIISVFLYGFDLFPMLMAAIAVLYFLDFFKVISISFSKLIGPIIVLIFGVYILISAIKGKNSFREVKKDPEYVRASDRDKESDGNNDKRQ